ncbi:MAG: PAS domain S-box protein [Syntrophales bacterium]
MKDSSQANNKDLLEEMSALKQKIKELEQSESEGVRASKAARKSEAYFKAIIQNSSDIILILDKVGTITYASPSTERFLGYAPDELIGKRTLDLIVSDDKPRAIEDFSRALLTKEVPIHNVFRIMHKDGAEHILEGIGKNLLDDPIVAGFVMNVRDITDRKQMEDALRASEERYRTILENIEDGYFEVDIAGNLTFFNDAVCRMTGSARAEMMGMNNRQYADKENSEILYRAFNKVFKTGEPSIGVGNEIIRKDGRKLHIESSISLIRNTSNQPIGFRGIMRNVTKRKQIEKEAAILSDIGRLIGSTLDIDEVYERVAAEVRKLIPFDRLTINLNDYDQNTVTVAYAFGSNVPGRRLGDSLPLQGSINEALAHTKTGILLHPTGADELAGQYPHIVSTFQAGINSFMSVPLIYRDELIGAIHFRSKTPNAYTENDLRLAERIGAQIAGAIANAQLFSDLKKAEKSLRESEVRFRGLVEQAAVGVAEIDMNTGQFLTVNRRLCEMVGRTQGEMMATTVMAITHPEDLHLHDEKRRMMLAGEIGHYSLEKRYLRKDGETVWVNITVSPLWKPGEIPGRNMIVVGDITDRKRMEEEIREMSLRDGLTELYNRRGFITLAEQQIRAANRGKRAVLVTFIDYDGLKRINDTLGHKEGDRALIDTADVLRRTFRESDIIARPGGDEFAVLSIDAAVMNLEDFSVRLQQHIAEFNARASRPYKLAMSWGTAVYDPESPLSLDELMSSADQRMYAQKKAKANQRM